MTEAARTPSALARLHEFGQSFWLDQISRDLIDSGDLARLRDEDGLRGVTSNPSIFKTAILGSDDYDESIRRHIEAGHEAEETYEAIAIRDIQDACDVLRPVYEESDGADGFVSLELSPVLAHDAERSLADTRRLCRRVDRPNLCLKIPATPEGLPVIEQALYEGHNVNVTLIFALDVYEQVAEAYLRALERRVREGKPVDRMASVASFFVSRIDVLVDQWLEERMSRSTDDGGRLQRLLGKTAVASAKIAYQRFKRLFHSDRFRTLAARGARVQRPLWASTSTKNPHYRDVMYVEPLIGPHTVNTLPMETAKAFREHGVVAATLEEGVEEAHAVLAALPGAGIDLAQVTEQLLVEGVKKFIDPFQELLAAIEQKRRQLAQARRPG